METSAFIDLVQENIGSELSRSKALEYTNNAQNDLLRRANRFMRIVPDPFLTTVAGTFQYAASTSLFSSVGGTQGATQYDVRLVSRIYSISDSLSYGGDYGRTKYAYEPNSDFSEVTAPVTVIQSKKANAEDCQLIWWEQTDPGSTTIDWRAEAYRWPNQLLSESVDLEIPDGFQDTLLLYKVLKRLGIRQFGSPGADLETMIREEQIRFNLESSMGASTRQTRTDPSEV